MSHRLLGVLTLLTLACSTLARTSADPPDPEVILAPEGGRLEAVDEDGTLIGPCPLTHTDVETEVSGMFARVTLTQTFHNRYDRKIEAVYTFPMSHRAAVDRMTMTVGERVVEAEIKEREEARQIYEAARAQGFVASLLEQERPNIFTQSVANIEPNATVTVMISYVEVLEAREGVYEFAFPTVVGPRYVPGAPTVSPAIVPAQLEVRRGAILRGPAQFELTQIGEAIDELGTLQLGKFTAILTAARPIKRPEKSWLEAQTWYTFKVTYAGGSAEPGKLYGNGIGVVGDRWFYSDPDVIREMGTGFAQDTNQVPDASKITPMPTRPGTRAGHDISIAVTIDTGGPAITDIDSALHAVDRTDHAASHATIALANESEIPNRDFVLRWQQANEQVEESVLTHVRENETFGGGYVTMILAPPTRVEPETIPPRELIFVLDTSGSMSGHPIEKSKELMDLALDAMRPGDTFNVITFAGRTEILWKKPKPAAKAHRDEAANFIKGLRGRGGTEMMTAINAALVQPKRGDDRLLRIVMFLTDGYVGNDMAIIDAVRENADTTRVFGFGVGNSVNRYLLDGMSRAGRGVVEYVLLASDADEVVERLARRIQNPVLTDIEIEVGAGLVITEMIPSPNAIPDLFDAAPIVIHGRYTEPGQGTVTLRGRTATGVYEHEIAVELPEHAPAHAAVATTWARGRVGELMGTDLAAAQMGTPDETIKSDIITLGQSFGLVTQYTSFVAVERSRATVGGQPVLIDVPIEMPDGVSFEGIFGKDDTDGIVLASIGGAPAGNLLGGGLGGGGRGRGAPGRRRASSPAALGRTVSAGARSSGGGGFGGSGEGAIAFQPKRDVGSGSFVPPEDLLERIAGHLDDSDLAKARDDANRLAMMTRDVDACMQLVRELYENTVDQTQVRKLIETARPILADRAHQRRLDRIIHEDLRDATDRVLVTVLLTDTEPATLDDARAAGLTIETVVANVTCVIGRVESTRLEDLAMTDTVRRIAPTRMRPASEGG